MTSLYVSTLNLIRNFKKVQLCYKPVTLDGQSSRFQTRFSGRNATLNMGLTFAILLTSFLVAATAFAQEKQKSHPLKEPLSAFSAYVGTWEIDATWANGSKLWAKNEYSIGMNGNFFEASTWTKNEAGKTYLRYKTIWRHNPEKDLIEAYGFTYDGTVNITESELDSSNPKRPIIRSLWRPNPESPYIKQEVQISEDGKTYDWRVWNSADKKEWTKLMEGVYKRVGETESR